MPPIATDATSRAYFQEQLRSRLGLSASASLETVRRVWDLQRREATARAVARRRARVGGVLNSNDGAGGAGGQ